MSILIENVSKKFGEKTVLDNINLEIKTGSLVALLGGSGSGKSTLLRVVAGFEQPDLGRVWLHGKNSNLSVQEKEIGFVFQAYALFKHLTVYENIAFGMCVNRSRISFRQPEKSFFSPFSFLSNKKENDYSRLNRKVLWSQKNLYKGHLKEDLAKNTFEKNTPIVPNASTPLSQSVEELLRIVQLEEFADRYPNQLSGGQCQRVALARALAVQPKVLLLDEPFGALDMKVRKGLRRWLRQLHERVRVTTLFVTHDHQEAMEVANEIVVLDKGRVKHSLQSPQKIYNRLAFRGKQ